MSARSIDATLSTFCHEIGEYAGLLLLTTNQVLESHGQGMSVDDPVGVEATMNKRYVVDLMGGMVDESAHEELMVCGRAILQVWAERISLHFPNREVLFYLGGSESVILRFHVRREGRADWANLADRRFLTESKLEVHWLRDRKLTMLTRGSPP